MAMAPGDGEGGHNRKKPDSPAVPRTLKADGTELWRRENLTSPGLASQFMDPGRKEMPEVG